MPKSEPFERHADRYDDWFEANPDAYRSEVEALRRLLRSRDSASRSASVAAGLHHPSECRSVSTPPARWWPRSRSRYRRRQRRRRSAPVSGRHVRHRADRDDDLLRRRHLPDDNRSPAGAPSRRLARHRIHRRRQSRRTTLPRGKRTTTRSIGMRSSSRRTNSSTNSRARGSPTSSSSRRSTSGRRKSTVSNRSTRATARGSFVGIEAVR